MHFFGSATSLLLRRITVCRFNFIFLADLLVIRRMMMQNPNCIVLDQPTNHLDLESIQSFNEQCIAYNGVVLLTSHDHTFMHTTANRIIELTPNGVIDRLTTFDEFLEDERVHQLQAEMYK